MDYDSSTVVLALPAGHRDDRTRWSVKDGKCYRHFPRLGKLCTFVPFPATNVESLACIVSFVEQVSGRGFPLRALPDAEAVERHARWLQDREGYTVRWRDDPSRGVVGSFVPRDLSWAFIGIRKWPAPGGWGYQNRPAETIRACREAFPPELRDVAMVWRWADDAGFGPTVKASIGVWLSEPADWQALRHWANGARLFFDEFDPDTLWPWSTTVLTPPLFEGLGDPVRGLRTLLVPGARATLKLPDWWTTEQRKRRLAERYGVDPDLCTTCGRPAGATASR
jgi:hypothetical protein